MDHIIGIEATIGARLRVLRRWRGLTQEQLAGLVGVTPSAISLWENGKRLLDRRSQISAVARALEVAEADLTGVPHLSADRVQSDPHRFVPPLRAALQANTLACAVLDQARPVSGLRAELADAVEPLRRVCEYTGVGRLLPDLLDELYVHAVGSGTARREALEGLVDAGVIAAAVAKELGYADLAALAAQRAEEAAAALGDPLSRGKADFMWLLTLPRQSWDRNLVLAERACEALEPHARDRAGLEVLGMLTLTASLSAAASQRPDAARGWLEEAAAIAARVPDDPTGNWQAFSAVNVAIWRITIGLERGIGGPAVLDLASRVDAGKLEPRASRRAGFYADVGRGLAREPRTRDAAVRWLRNAEKVAPQRARNNMAIRETVGYLLGRQVAAAGGRELRGMASRMGLLS